MFNYQYNSTCSPQECSDDGGWLEETKAGGDDGWRRRRLEETTAGGDDGWRRRRLEETTAGGDDGWRRRQVQALSRNFKMKPHPYLNDVLVAKTSFRLLSRH